LILSGEAISAAVLRGDIVIDPFDQAQIGPNSYDFRLGSRCKVYRDNVLDSSRRNEVHEFSIPNDGLTLSPGRIYLVNTLETMGSTKYVPIIRGRSSTGRLGLFIDITADLIDLGSVNQWTLQLAPILPLRVYPGMLVGQVTFWVIQGDPVFYAGKYNSRMSPMESLSYKDFEEGHQNVAKG
jgi:dCTP deaminase